MKKVFGQTVRDIKREVNKKVLKVPGIEQKVLDATSNEAWGPHGTLLADIAQATRNYHEYQMIISVLWKRMSDTGKNWRHVYKALTVLEYLVANGSERVIDDIREHAHQISGLSGFQYIDSSGRDQGSNIRKKSQSLVALVNDKERIIEVRQKAVANREKFRTSSTSGMYRPGSYDDDRNEGRYGSRDDDRNGYGREREWGSRDDDRYNRNGDSYGQDGDRNGRDNEDHYGRDGYKDDDYRGRSRSSDENQHASRSRSSDRGRDRAYDDDGQYSSRSGVQAGDESQNGGEQERKFSEQNIGVPPSYEEAVSDSRSPVQSGRDGETASPLAARASPHISDNPSQEAGTSNDDASSAKQIVEPFDEFDPRGSVVTPVSAPAAASSSVEMDLLGSLDTFSSNTLAIMPATPATTPSETNVHANLGSGPTYAATPSASDVATKAYENPFGDAPFKAIPSTGSEPQLQPSTSAAQFHIAMNQNAEHPQLGTPSAEVGIDLGFGESFSAITYPESSAPAVQTPTNSQFLPQEPSNSQQDIDILADILPPSGPQPVITSQAPFPPSAGHPAQQNTNYYGGFPSQANTVAPVTTPNMAPQTQAGAMQGAMVLHPQNHPAGVQLGSGNLHSLGGSVSPQYPTGSAAQFNGGNFLQQQGSHLGSQSALPTMSGAAEQFNNGNFLPQQGSQVGSQSSLRTVSGTAAQFNGGDFLQQQGSQPAFHTMNSTAGQFNNGNSLQQQGSQLGSQSTLQTMSGTGAQHNNHMLGNLHPQPGLKTQTAPQPRLPSSTGPLSTVSQPSREKFETKSTVWADTLSRGLVDLNISGAKTNPLADIGVDFEAINRREKRMEKPSNSTTQQVTSTVTMGKAMGSGSGIGRAGANTLRPAANPMMGPGMGMGGGYGGMPQPMGGMGMGMNMGMNPGMNQGMGMNSGMNQGMGMNPGMNQGMGMNPGMNQGMGMNPGMGMNMRMGQGAPMQPPNGLPPGGYNPMMGQQPYGGYAQQPYGGGYR